MRDIAIMMTEINKWASIYHFSFQFWGDNNNNVFIEKDGVDLHSCGGFDTPEEAIEIALQWVDKQNPKGFSGKRKTKMLGDYDLCKGCGDRIAKGNEYCGECLCEEDGYL